MFLTVPTRTIPAWSSANRPDGWVDISAPACSGLSGKLRPARLKRTGQP
jgi:hypothetical protein